MNTKLKHFPLSIPICLSFGDYELKIHIKPNDVLFNSGDVCNILNADIKTRSCLPEFICFSELLCLCSEFTNFKFASYSANIMMSMVDIEQWQGRFRLSYMTFIHSFVLQDQRERSELYQQELFKQKFLNGDVPELKGFSSLTNAIKNRLFQPDFVFTNANGDIAVGEMKIIAFKKSMLKQVNSYLVSHKTDMAFVIAPTIECDLPDNIIFIKHKSISSWKV